MSGMPAWDEANSLRAPGRGGRHGEGQGQTPAMARLDSASPSSALSPSAFRHPGRVRPRSADEWRRFWHHGGDAELRAVLRASWPPLHDAPEQAAARPAERVATLLGSNAPARALVSELGRIRADELGADPDPESDGAAAETITTWFESVAARDAKS
jgi:hypothetical protein